MKNSELSFGGSSILISVDRILPRYGKVVVVRTSLDRRLAFLDPRTGWHDARDGSRIQDVQSWYLD